MLLSSAGLVQTIFTVQIEAGAACQCVCVCVFHSDPLALHLLAEDVCCVYSVHTTPRIFALKEQTVPPLSRCRYLLPH